MVVFEEKFRSFWVSVHVPLGCLGDPGTLYQSQQRKSEVNGFSRKNTFQKKPKRIYATCIATADSVEFSSLFGGLVASVRCPESQPMDQCGQGT